MGFDLIKNHACNLCGLAKYRKNIVNGYGPANAKILVVGEGPGLKEDEQGAPFIGPYGQLFRKLLQQAGIDFREVYFSNMVRCFPKSPDPKKLVREPEEDEIAACSPFLEQEIAAVKPTIIVPAGNVALRYFLEKKAANITSHRGSEIWSEKYNCKIMPVIHPAAILRNPKFEGVTIEDLKRVRASSQTREIISRPLGEYTVADTWEKVQQLFDHLSVASDIAFDIETTDLDWWKSEIISIAFSWEEGKAWTLPLLKAGGSYDRFWDDGSYIRIWGELQRVMALPSRKIAHNGKFDIKHLDHHGLKINNFHFDTMLAHHLLDENAENLHGLKDCAWVYTDMGGYDKPVDDFFKENKKFKKQYIMLPFDMITKYNAADADCTFRLFKKFDPMLKEQDLVRVFRQITMAMTDVLLATEIGGVEADKTYIENLRKEYTAKRDQLELQIYAAAGEAVAKAKGLPPSGPLKFNINSAIELRDLLFKKLGLKSVKTTPKGAQSTDAETLETLAKNYPDHPVPNLLAKYRETTKLLSTFIEGLSEHIATDGRIHSTYKQHGTTTGRLSSSEPNLQNIPRETLIRGIFIPKPGYTMIEADYSGAEFRWWAQYSQDPQMVADIQAGHDIHKMTASSANGGIPIKDVTKKMRQDAKAVVFGLMYGRSTWSIANELEIDENAAKKIVNTFFGRYPQARTWLEGQVFKARRTGQLRNYFGRIRRLPGINSPNEMVRGESERQAKNCTIQSAASDTTCTAAIRIRRRIRELGLDVKLVLTVHDSLIYEVPDKDVVLMLKIIREEMERPVTGVNVPMQVEIKVGHRWGTMILEEEYLKQEAAKLPVTAS